jgi:hypothetical protein
MRVAVAFVMLVIAAAACGDNPSLRIVVERPAEKRYQDEITTTTISIYESSETNAVTCEEVEFSDIAPEQLLGALVAEQTISKTGKVTGTLDNISRLGPKVIVARLYSDLGVMIAAGCAEQDEIKENTTVTIQSTVAATVAFDGLDTPSRDDPYGKLVTVLDPLGESLDNFPVRWRVSGPFGATPGRMINVSELFGNTGVWESAKPSCTSADATVNIHPVEPANVSGFITRLRVSWAQPEVYSAFVRPDAASHLLIGAVSGNRCAARANPDRELVCITNGNVGEVRHFRLEKLGNGFALVDQGAMTVPSIIGVVAIDDLGHQEVFGITSSGAWARLFGGSNVGTKTCSGCTVDDFRLIPACGAKAKLALHTSLPASPIHEMELLGVKDSQPFALGLLDAGVDPLLDNAGCLTQDNAGDITVLQALALDFTRTLPPGPTITRAALSSMCGTAHCTVALPFPDAGVGFLKTTGGESQMIGTSFDVAGAELTSWVLRPAGGTFHLIERQHIAAAAPPNQIVVGRFDNDTEDDLLWGIGSGRNSAFQVSYFQKIEGTTERLSALGAVGTDTSSIQVADLNGDGIDDIIAVGVGLVTVIPVGVAGKDPSGFTFNDTTCN